MNIHFPQVERKSQLFSYLVAASATFTMLMLGPSLSRQVEIHLSIPPISMQAAGPTNGDTPVAIPAPVPPIQSTESISAPGLAGDVPVILVPETIPAPVPSVP